MVCQNRQVIATSFGCCWYSGGTPQSLECWSSCNVQRKMGARWEGVEGDSGVVIEDIYEDSMRNLGDGMVLMLMRAGILFGEAALVVVGVMVVEAVGVMSLFEKRSLLVTEVEVEVKCVGVSFGLIGGNILGLGGGFVAAVVEMEMYDLELEVGVVVRPVWGCLNGRLYFLWGLSRMSLEEKMSSVGGRSFGMVIWEDFFMGLYFLGGTCLGKVTASQKEVEVFKVVVWVVWANLGVLLEVVILLKLMDWR